MHSTKTTFLKQLSSNDPNLNLVFYATIINNLGLLKKAIELGDNVNIQDEYGLTPLHMATFVNFDLVKCLVENGADVNAVNIHGYTPLFYSMYHNDPYLCSYLVKHGAKVDAKNNFGETPLHIATYLNNISAVRTMVRLGANVDIPDDRGVLPIGLALNMKNFNMIRCLVKLGANINVLNKKGYSLLRVSLNEKNFKLVRYLVKMGTIITDRDISGLSHKFLKALSKSKNPKNLKILIKISLKLKDANLLTCCLDKFYQDLSKNSICRLPFHRDNPTVNKYLNNLNNSLDNISNAQLFVHELYTSYNFILLKKILSDPNAKISTTEKSNIDTMLTSLKKFRKNVNSLLNTTVIDSIILPAKAAKKNHSLYI